MEILPLNKLFLTKEDRLAVYKAFKIGVMPQKSQTALSTLEKYIREHDDVAKVTEKVVKSAGGADPLAELADETGMDLLELKQMHFLELLSEKSKTSDTSPYECENLEDLDSLGRKIFGDDWDVPGAEETTWEVDYPKSTISAIESFDMKPIPNPCIYPEMFLEEDIKHLSGLTLLALVSVGYIFSRLVNSLFEGNVLKNYLNGEKPGGEIGEKLTVLEEAFAMALYQARANYLYMPLGSEDVKKYHSNYTAWSEFDKEALFSTPVLSSTVRYNKWELFRELVMRFSASSCALRAYLSKEDIYYRSDESFLFGCDEEELRFILDGVVHPYITDTWKSVSTGVSRFTYDKDDRLYVIADMTRHPKNRIEAYNTIGDSTWDDHSCEGLYDYEIPFYFEDIRDLDLDLNIFDIPAGVDRAKLSDALSYAGGIRCYKYIGGSETFDTSPIPYKADEDDIVAMVVHSCFVSPLLRDGVRLYFAFRAEGSKAEPLKLYVDNEADLAYVKEQAAVAGADLSGGLNSVELIATPDVIPFSELTEGDDALYGTYATEWMKVSLMLIRAGMESPMFNKSADDGFYSVYQDKCGLKGFLSDNNSGGALFSTDADPNSPDDAILHRNIIPIDNVTESLVRGDNLLAKEQSDSTSAIFTYGTFDLTKPAGDRMSLLAGVSGTVYKTAGKNLVKASDWVKLLQGGHTFTFLDSTALHIDGDLYSCTIPLLCKGFYCKAVRWSEIPGILPELREAWSYIESLPIHTLTQYLTAFYKSSSIGEVLK